MLGLYTKKAVKQLVARIKEEYDGVLAAHTAAEEELKAQNRVLQARVLELEGERGSVSDALIAAAREGERLKQEGEAETERERRELALLTEKCRAALARLAARYPDEEDIAAFSSFCDELDRRLGTEEETVFDMEEVVSPKGPLDLGALCREFGLMEDDEQ